MVTLCLKSKQELTEQQIEVRRSLITQLLSVRQQFAVQLEPATWQPFPTQLANRVTCLTVDSSDLPVSICCQWTDMPNLRSLRFTTCTGDDVNKLCDAVEAGQLPHLRCLDCGRRQVPNGERLLQVLAPQLEELSAAWDLNIQPLTALRTFSTGAQLSAAMMQQMCEHPTLHHVVLLQQSSVLDDYSQLSCKWVTLTLQGTDLSELPLLPLASVQQVQIVGSLEQGYSRDPQALETTLGQYASRITCRPSSESNDASFTVSSFCGAMAPLVAQMQGVKTLVLTRSSHKDIALLWLSLPQSVSCVHIQDQWDIMKFRLWHDLPAHVTAVMLTRCHVTAADLCTLVRTTPPHVCNLAIIPKEGGEAAAWLAAGLPAATPKHLTLELHL